MSGRLRGAGPVVRGQRRPVRRHPAAGRGPGGGARRQPGGVPGEDAALHAASPAGTHRLGQQSPGSEGGGRDQGAGGEIQRVCAGLSRAEDPAPGARVSLHHLAGEN